MRTLSLIVSIFFSISVYAQEAKLFQYGNLDSWITRTIVDSKMIGGKTHKLHEVGTVPVTKENVPFIKSVDVPWRTSNVYADMIVQKGSTTVFSEKRDDGYCARLETRLEEVKVLGMFNVRVIAAGSLYCGDFIEPVTSMEDAAMGLNRGIRFTQNIKSIVFDYKYHSAGERYYANGLSKPKLIGGTNLGEVIVMLQNRWEDSKGNIYARRIATAHKLIEDTNGKWDNGFELELYYGDYNKTGKISTSVELLTKDTPKDFIYYGINSKGKTVPIIEVGWSVLKDEPTHLFIMFSSSQSGAFVGAPDSKLWIDNIGYIERTPNN